MRLLGRRYNDLLRYILLILNLGMLHWRRRRIHLLLRWRRLYRRRLLDRQRRRRLDLHLLRRCLDSLLRRACFGGLLLQMCLYEIVKLALANVIGFLLRLLQGKAHAARGCQELQEIIGSIVSLLRRHDSGSSGRGGSSSLGDFTHTTVVASSKLLVHFQNSIRQFFELTSAHVSMFLLKHAFKQFTLFAHPDRHASKHLLPAVPNIVVAVLHPAHVTNPMFMEAEPTAVETYRSGRSKIATGESRTIHHWPSDKATSPTAISDMTPHGDGDESRMLYSDRKSDWVGI